MQKSLTFQKENGNYIARFQINNGYSCVALIEPMLASMYRITVTTTTQKGRETETINYAPTLAEAKALMNRAFTPILA